MTLINLVQQYEDRVSDSDKESLSTLGFVDKPPFGILPLNEAIRRYNPQPGDSFTALVKVSELFSDSKYNRAEKIHYANIRKNLIQRGGFSYRSSGVISAFLRPTKEIVVSKGNHRSTQAYACRRDPQAVIAVEITIHSTNSYEEIVRIESQDHNVDCNYRTSQSQEDKFKSAFYAREPVALSLYDFLDKYRVGIADTNPSALFSVSSHAFVEKARALDSDLCERYLRAFTENNCESEVGGNAIFAGTSFLRYFKDSLNWVDKHNNVDSFDLFMRYIYKDRSDLSYGFLTSVTQSKLTEGNGKFKGEEINVARLISLYNEFCLKVLRAKIPTSNKDAIGYSSQEYFEFLKKADETVRARVDEISRQTV